MEAVPKENADLLPSSAVTNGIKRPEEPVNGPADGGCRAYAVVVASFLTNGIIFGVINSYSEVHAALRTQLTEAGVSNAESKSALVGVLAMSTMFLLSALTGVVTRLLGLQRTAVLGGLIAAAALFICSFIYTNVTALCFTYGIMYGLGASFAYTPSLAILGHYFQKYLGRANGFVTIGSSAFTVVIAPLMSIMIKRHGLEGMYRLLAAISLVIAISGFLFKPIPSMVLKKPTREDGGSKGLLKSLINVAIWNNKRYRLWTLSMTIALFGYFVPYIHIKTFTENQFGTSVRSELPLQCISIGSGIGRLLFGFLADSPGIDRILLQQISFYVIGTLTIILPFVTIYSVLLVIAVCMGIFDGAFIVLIGPVAIETCGGASAAQAIGYMLGLASIPLSMGAPISGYLYSLTGAYTLSFVLAGISPLLGATLMFTLRFHRLGTRPSPVESNANGHAMLVTDVEKEPVPLLDQHKTINQQATL